MVRRKVMGSNDGAAESLEADTQIQASMSRCLCRDSRRDQRERRSHESRAVSRGLICRRSAIVLSREKPTHTLQVSNVGVVFLGDAKPGKLGVGASWQQSEAEVSLVQETRLKIE